MDEVKWWDLALSIGTQLDHEKLSLRKGAEKLVVTLSKKGKAQQVEERVEYFFIKFFGDGTLIYMHKTYLNEKTIFSASLRTLHKCL